ncbi:MAG TPA: magnesium/cobalt transporter CorA [Tepidisphaeraceae bacterium]|mgnify:CR=1 FL=1|nr:magnesium/cobalt transporter CorA [Tepidisphaeraceae bacterium]
MIQAFIKFGDGRTSTDATQAGILAALRDPNATFWIDMEAPSDDELAILDDVFGFHPLAIEDTIQYNQRPKIESYNHIGDANQQGYFYMVIHGPDLQHFRENLRTKELDVFVSQRYLLTVHEENHRSITDVAARAKLDPRVVLDPGIDLLLYNILDHLVDNYNPILDFLQEEIDDLEEQAITDPKPDLLPRIAAKKRDLLNLRRIIGPQRDVLAILTRGEVPFIRETARTYLRDVQDHLIRAVELIELYRDLTVSARDIYLSSVSNNLNTVMKTLTIITVIALPLNVVTGFWGMNFELLPIGSQVAFWISIALMVGTVSVLLMIFRRLRWL